GLVEADLRCPSQGRVRPQQPPPISQLPEDLGAEPRVGTGGAHLTLVDAVTGTFGQCRGFGPTVAALSGPQQRFLDEGVPGPPRTVATKDGSGRPEQPGCRLG